MGVEIRAKGRERFEDASLLVLTMEEGATSQGMQVTSRSWERQGNQFTPEASSRNTALRTRPIPSS